MGASARSCSLWTPGIINFKDPVEGPLVGKNAFLHDLVVAKDLLNSLVLLGLLVLEMLEVVAIIYNRDMAVIKVHHASISRRDCRDGSMV